MPFVLFDFSDSSFGIIDIQNFITFYEYGSDEIDSILSLQEQSIGYDSPTFLLNN